MKTLLKKFSDMNPFSSLSPTHFPFLLLMSHITYFYIVYLLTNYYSYSYFNTIIFKLLYYS